jgi:anti-sigma factor RsiW
MTHLDEGTLQAFLDDELPPADRAAVAEHLLACASCHAAHEELMQANALFSQSVAVLDVEPPTRTPVTRAVRTGARVGTSSFVKAAGLILALAAAASAAVPGSPVREWIVRVVEPEPAVVETEPTPTAPPVAAAPAPVGLSIAPAEGRVVVALSELDGATIRLEGVEGERARVSVTGAQGDPVFRTMAGRVEVRGCEGGVVHVRLPEGAASARLEVEGTLYAERRQGEVRVLVPADTADGAIIWR